MELARLTILALAAAIASCASTGLSKYQGTDLKFESTSPRSFKVAHIWSGSSGAFVADLVEKDGLDCIDLYPMDERVKADLRAFDDYPSLQRSTPKARFEIVVDAVASVPPSRATIVAWGEGEPGVSSAAWYRNGGEQVFLVCPANVYDWHVYRVVSVRSVPSSGS